MQVGEGAGRPGRDDGRGLAVFVPDSATRPVWQRLWADLFDRSGYDCVLVPWPAGSGADDPVGPHQLTGTVRRALAELPGTPILIGAGAGGLTVRRLLDPGVAAAGIVIDPATGRDLGPWLRRPVLTAERAPLLLLHERPDASPAAWRDLAVACLDWLTHHDL